MLHITATLGPASAEAETISALLQVADRFRLNASHLDATGLAQWLERITSVFHAQRRKIPVVLDLQGAKMRIGKIPPLAGLPTEVELRLASSSTSPEVIPVPHAVLFEDLRAGDTVTLNDARITLKILKLNANSAVASVLVNGPLSSHKGINRENHPLPYRELAPYDREAIEQSRDFPTIEYAFSFVHTGEEAALLRPLIGEKRLIAKLEREEAMNHLARIDQTFDELWLCRGDLGSQAGLRKLGPIQAALAAKLGTLQHPVLVAGQVLEHMTHFPQPTRSEVVHLFDLERAGYGGIVLSDETAIGKNPRAVGEFLRNWRQ